MLAEAVALARPRRRRRSPSASASGGSGSAAITGPPVRRAPAPRQHVAQVVVVVALAQHGDDGVLETISRRRRRDPAAQQLGALALRCRSAVFARWNQSGSIGLRLAWRFRSAVGDLGADLGDGVVDRRSAGAGLRA